VRGGTTSVSALEGGKLGAGLTQAVDRADHESLRGQLRLWRRRQSVESFKRGEPRPDLSSSSEGTPLVDSRIRKAVTSIINKADVRQRKSIIHAFRHTFASLLIQQGETLVYVKEQLGHSSIQITVDVYGHLVPGGNRGAVDRLYAAPKNATEMQSGERRSA
jgi:integrase